MENDSNDMQERAGSEADEGEEGMGIMKTRAIHLGLGFLLSVLVVGSAGAATAGGHVVRRDEVYDAVKKVRAEAAQRCIRDLLALADKCAESDLAGEELACLELATKLGDSAGAEKSLTEAGEEARIHLQSVRSKLESSGSSTISDSGARDRLSRKRKEIVKKFVDAMNKLTQRCLDAGFPVQAYELILWTLQFDPSNAILRKVLGEEPYRDKAGKVSWYRKWELDRVRKGSRLDPEFGWLTPLQAEKLEKGLLWWEKDKTWKPRADVEELRRSWANRWTFETEHFQIATNAPLAEAIAFGREVERLYLLFFRVFADLYAAEDKKLAGLLVFGGGKSLGRKLGIHYYGSQASYLEEILRDRELVGSDLRLERESAGFYNSLTGKVYFYRGNRGPDLSTVFHEVVHQIFGETFGKCAGSPCWLTEGLAVFLESPTAVGEGEAHRFLVGAEIPRGFRDRDSARNIDDFLKTCGTENTFHGDQRLDNYAMAGAVVHFFNFHRGGAYREGFLRYARSALRGGAPVQKLYEALGVTEKKLQEEWKEFCQNPSLFSF